MLVHNLISALSGADRHGQAVSQYWRIHRGQAGSKHGHLLTDCQGKAQEKRKAISHYCGMQSTLRGNGSLHTTSSIKSIGAKPPLHPFLINTNSRRTDAIGLVASHAYVIMLIC